MDNQEGSKNAFAVGSKFDHLSPEHHSTSLQKKVLYIICGEFEYTNLSILLLLWKQYLLVSDHILILHRSKSVTGECNLLERLVEQTMEMKCWKDLSILSGLFKQSPELQQKVGNEFDILYFQ